MLGCGGAITKLVQGGYEAYTLILGEGVTSRDIKRNTDERRDEIDKLKRQAEQANKIIGVKEVFFSDFPDNRLDSVPLLDIIKEIESVKNKIQPTIVFTHYDGDLNIDHQITYRAAVTAFRPLNNETVKEMYSFEVPSSTEWSGSGGFTPDVYFDVTPTFACKLEAMKAYESELREYPHPRSIGGLEVMARNRGISIGVNYAEVFKCVRIIR